MEILDEVYSPIFLKYTAASGTVRMR